MEKIIYTLLTAILFSITSNAQESYETGMTKALKLWEEDKTLEAVDQFEELGETEENRWLPFYYASEIKITEAFEMTDVKRKEQQLKEAEVLLKKAKAVDNADTVELMVLEAMLHTAYIAMSPMEYGPSLSPVVTGVLDSAFRMESTNPRVALFRAEWNIGSAPYMGNDPKIFCKDLKASLALFEQDTPSEAFAPEWGEERAQSIIADLCGE